MSKIVWDATGKKYYETGLRKGVLYPMASEGYGTGVPWNGLTSVSESPSGAEVTDLYADDIKYASLRSAETFGATVEAYTYPDEFAECDGSKTVATGVTIGQQARKPFGLSYVTQIGSDTSTAGGDDGDYLIHIIFNATASPSEKQYQTINDSPEAITFSWELNTTAVNVTGHKATATMVIDSRKATAEKLKALEDKLYGTDSTEPTLPSPDEIIAMMQ